MKHLLRFNENASEDIVAQIDLTEYYDRKEHSESISLEEKDILIDLAMTIKLATPGYHFFDDHLRMYTVDSNLCITKVQDSYWVFEIEPLRKNVKYFYKIDDMIGVRELFRRLSL